MSKYAFGTYHAIVFNKLGTKTKVLTGLPSMLEAQAEGKKIMPDGGSVVVMRVVINTAHNGDLWRSNDTN